MLRGKDYYRVPGFGFDQHDENEEIRFRIKTDEIPLVEEVTEVLYNEGILPEASINLLGRFALAKFLNEFQQMEMISLEKRRQERFQRRQPIGRQM